MKIRKNESVKKSSSGDSYVYGSLLMLFQYCLELGDIEGARKVEDALCEGIRGNQSSSFFTSKEKKESDVECKIGRVIYFRDELMLKLGAVKFFHDEDSVKKMTKERKFQIYNYAVLKGNFMLARMVNPKGLSDLGLLKDFLPRRLKQGE